MLTACLDAASFPVDIMCVPLQSQDARGSIMVNMKQESNALKVPGCSIQALLSAPNPDDPLAENVAKHWKQNEIEAVATGKLHSFMQLGLSLLFQSIAVYFGSSPLVGLVARLIVHSVVFGPSWAG